MTTVTNAGVRGIQVFFCEPPNPFILISTPSLVFVCRTLFFHMKQVEDLRVSFEIRYNFLKLTATLLLKIRRATKVGKSERQTSSHPHERCRWHKWQSTSILVMEPSDVEIEEIVCLCFFFVFLESNKDELMIRYRVCLLFSM